MPGQASVDKMRVSLLLPVKTVKKLDRMAANGGMSRNEVANTLLDRGTASVELTDSDLDAIVTIIRQNREKRNGG